MHTKQDRVGALPAPAVVALLPAPEPAPQSKPIRTKAHLTSDAPIAMWDRHEYSWAYWYDSRVQQALDARYDHLCRYGWMYPKYERYTGSPFGDSPVVKRPPHVNLRRGAAERDGTVLFNNQLNLMDCAHRLRG